MSVTVVTGSVVTMDPADVRTFVFDWDAENLASGVTIATSTFTITPIKQSDATEDLTKDNPTILNASEATTALGRTVGTSRATLIRLIATTANVGDKYEIANTIVTSESPTQTKERRFFVLIQNK